MGLIERQYLGEGYIHVFKHNKTGEVINVPCTKEEYEALAKPYPTNPTLDDHTWLYSIGGTHKVDTPDTTLGKDEYCIVGGEAVVNRKGLPPDKAFEKLPAESLMAEIALEIM